MTDDLLMVANTQRPSGTDLGATRLDPSRPEIAKLMADHVPFYAAPDYQSPIERVFPAGYMGKDGVLPAGDVEAGRFRADAVRAQ